MSKLKLVPILVIIVLNLIFFKSFFFQGKLPVPSDTIVGLYYPFRELYFNTNPNGLPYKNFLITDPVRQQYPWKNLSINIEKQLSLPLWNPYNFAGTPLLANGQSSALNPLNILFFIFPFSLSWGFLIFIQPLLAGIFFFLYLRNLKIDNTASLLGSLSFSFSGFFVAWMEWGTILQTAMWLPLILLSIDKIIIKPGNNKIKWAVIFVFSLVFSFLAGHLQTFFYLFELSFVYILVRWFQQGKGLRTLGIFLISFLIFSVITFVQWYPTLQFILLSARNLDTVDWRTIPGWFIPWQNMIQFISPDFFGNPATLNYWGTWNYGEFIGYIGIAPLILSFFALFFRKDKKTFFYGAVFFLTLVFAFPTIFAKLPFKFDIPFVSTSQPTRLLFLTDFALSVLCSFGLDHLIKAKQKRGVFFILGGMGFVFATLWIFVAVFKGGMVSMQDLSVAKQNLLLPSFLFVSSAALLSLYIFLNKKWPGRKQYMTLILYLLVILSVFDLFRFGWKFEPFTNKEYLFPSTKITSFLKSQKGVFRIMSTDSRIFPPNFSIMYKLQSLEGYDPLYLQRYGEFMVASARSKSDISSPFGFNRIITPQDPLSRFSDLLGVRYVLSLEKIKNPKLKLVFTDGTVNVYENNLALPRAFFVSITKPVSSKQQAVNNLFDVKTDLGNSVVIEDTDKSAALDKNWMLGQAEITGYSENKVVIKTQNKGEGFLVLTDSYYPTWHAKIDGKETKIFLTDYNFRGIIVPKGNHTIEYSISIF